MRNKLTIPIALSALSAFSAVIGATAAWVVFSQGHEASERQHLWQARIIYSEPADGHRGDLELRRAAVAFNCDSLVPPIPVTKTGDETWHLPTQSVMLAFDRVGTTTSTFDYKPTWRVECDSDVSWCSEYNHAGDGESWPSPVGRIIAANYMRWLAENHTSIAFEATGDADEIDRLVIRAFLRGRQYPMQNGGEGLVCTVPPETEIVIHVAGPNADGSFDLRPDYS